MKNLLFYVAAIIFTMAILSNANAQVNVKDKVKNQTNNRANQKTDQAIDKGLDAIENGLKGVF